MPWVQQCVELETGHPSGCRFGYGHLVDCLAFWVHHSPWTLDLAFLHARMDVWITLSPRNLFTNPRNVRMPSLLDSLHNPPILSFIPTA